MPNGGVPLRMLLKPSSSENYVFFAENGSLGLYDSKEWGELGVRAKALLIIMPEELEVLSSYVQYTSGRSDKGPVYMIPGVDVEYE